MKRIILVLVTSLLLSSCQNTCTRKYGGSMTITLEPNEELLNITWKGDDLWLYVRDKSTNQKYFREDSKNGLLEGKITIIEK